MMDCHLECWSVDGVLDKFRGQLDEYSHDVVGVDIGPRKNKNPVNFWRRGPRESLLIQLAFHDCLRYEDGTGGCDGCLNWQGVGYRSPKAWGGGHMKKHPEWVDAWPKVTKTTNNKLQLSARSLELIYTLTDWPPGARSLDSSLRESGKSRADLWQFAGNIALEKAINSTSAGCQQEYDPKGNPERQLNAIEGSDKCEMRLERSIPFRSGRVDCIPDESLKWTPYAFEATKTEKHSNPHGSANQIIDNLRDDFNFTARDTISLMALHGLSGGINSEQSTKYSWIGGRARQQGRANRTFSNIYHKFLNGKTFWRGNNNEFGGRSYPDYFIGDKDGNPVGGTAWSIRCRMQWNDTESGEEKRKFGGPCDFRPSHPGNIQL